MRTRHVLSYRDTWVLRLPRLVAERRVATGHLALRHRHGLAATALAASLVLGVLAGQSNAFNVLLGGGGSRVANISQQLAQTDEADSFLDEDLL